MEGRGFAYISLHVVGDGAYANDRNIERSELLILFFWPKLNCIETIYLTLKTKFKFNSFPCNFKK